MALVLGIETSCDETAAAVVRRDAAGEVTVLSSVIATDASATLESDEVSSPGPPGLRSSGSCCPHASP